MGERLGWAEASAPGSWQRDRGLLVSPKAERSPACCPGRDPRQNRGDPHAAAATSWVCWWVTDPGSGLSSWPRGAELQCGPVWDLGGGGCVPNPAAWPVWRQAVPEPGENPKQRRRGAAVAVGAGRWVCPCRVGDAPDSPPSPQPSGFRKSSPSLRSDGWTGGLGRAAVPALCSTRRTPAPAAAA